jgi:hypothetical protein
MTLREREILRYPKMVPGNQRVEQSGAVCVDLKGIAYSIVQVT